MRQLTRRGLAGAVLGAGVLASQGARAAEEAVTFLFPAPSFLPAFVPHHLAQSRGHFAAEGVRVTFQIGRGGADVAKQVGVGNAELGGGFGDTPIIVRANGLPVRAVALLGGRPLMQIASRRAANIRSFADLRGKKVGVIAFQDSGFYNLLGVLAASGVRRADLNIQAVGNAGMTQLMISRDLDAITATPDWADALEQADVPLDYLAMDMVFPGFAQAVLASDKMVQERPAAVRGVSRAVLRALRELMQDPAAAARDFVAAVPQQAGKEVEVERILRRYIDQVYRTPRPEDLGRFDPERLRTVQRFYLENGVIQTAVPVEDLYSNAFIDA